MLNKPLATSPAVRGHRVVFDILTRYSLLEIAVPAVLAMLVIGFVGVVNELRERSQVLELDFLSAWDVARLVFYFSPTLVAYLIPIAFMMGILLAFGRLAQHNEITAMKAAGIPLKRLVAPVVIVGALLSAGTYFLQDRVQPRAIERANHLLFTELPERITLDVLPVGVMNEFGGVRVFFKERDAQRKTLRGVVVAKSESGRDVVYYADSAQFVKSGKRAQLVLRDCLKVQPQPGDDVFTQESREFTVPLTSKPLGKQPGRSKEMTLQELFKEEKASEAQYNSNKGLRRYREDLRTVRTEISDRITLPLACLAVGLAAAPLAVRAQRGGRSYSFAIGFVLLGGYYVLRILLEAKSVHPLEDYIVRGLAPNLVLCAIGLWALWRVDRV